MAEGGALVKVPQPTNFMWSGDAGVRQQWLHEMIGQQQDCGISLHQVELNLHRGITRGLGPNGAGDEELRQTLRETVSALGGTRKLVDDLIKGLHEAHMWAVNHGGVAKC